MPSYVVIGSSRGIGLEYVRQLAANPSNVVFALVRDKSKATRLIDIAEASKNVHVVQGDVVDAASLKAAADEVAKITGGSLDILIYSAARTMNETFFHTFFEYNSSEELDADFNQAFKVNVLGVIHTINTFLPLLRKGSAKKIVVLGAGAGNPDFAWKSRFAVMAAYSSTKGASAVVAAKYAVLLEEEGFTVVSLSPGLVNTADMSTVPPEILTRQTEAMLKMAKFNLDVKYVEQSPEESVSKQLKIIEAVRQNDAGGLLSHRGLDLVAEGKGGRGLDLSVYV
ncbi:hypothetical protein A0H81_12619 [Grifola frondosa]|uniref:NAD(P)-binding protein n=1 Tax=Grifola frondosa TaxID=5627 RepID=A0A1C7LRI7_GRIFR|nr:hypothetical protein A0H81_12619 [Grifola frondosa]